MILIFSAYLGIGVIAGMLAGLLGIGGGLLIVPTLLFVFAWQGIHESLAVPMALGTSLASVCVTSIASIHAHNRYKAVLWNNVQALAPGIVIGAMGGALLVAFLSTEAVRTFFSILVLTTAAQLGLGLKPPPLRRFPGHFGATIAGLLIGTVSALSGIGGGSIVVPYLIWCNIPVRNAVAIAAACGLPLALSGTIGFLISGWYNTNLPPYSLGFIYWPALIGIALTSTIFAQIGARTAQLVSINVLRHIFVLFLCIVGLYMWIH